MVSNAFLRLIRRPLNTRKKILVFIIILACILLFAIKWLRFTSHPSALPPNKLVEVESLKKQTIQETVRLLGTIHPKHVTVLVAKSSGILDTLIPTGEKVRKGTLVAKMDNPDLEKNLQLAATTESMTKSQFERLAPLLAKGYISSKDVDEKKQAWIDAQKEASRIKIEWENLHFYAPFDGIVGAYKKREGTAVNVGESVVVIYDPSTLVVDVDIPCSNLSALHDGQRAYVLGKSYVLSNLQKMLDEDTHMCPADINITCEDCLIGSTVDVDLVVAEKHDTLVVPFHAIFLRNGENYVYTVEDGKVKLMPVKTGLQQHDHIEIVEGLNPGMQVITKGQERLYPEMPVDVATWVPAKS